MGINAKCGVQRRVSAIDIGTNSVRLLIADRLENGCLKRIHTERRILRLGSDVYSTGRIENDSASRIIRVLETYIDCSEQHRANVILAAATQAIREAENAKDLLEELRERSGLEVRVLTGSEEAERMTAGVALLWPKPPDRFIAFDLGGGSTEAAVRTGETLEAHTSVPIGMVRVTKDMFHHDPPLPDEIDRCSDTVRNTYEKSFESLHLLKAASPLLVGTAGTCSTLASLDLGLNRYDPDRVNGHRLSFDRVNAWCDRLLGMKSEERGRLAGMEPQREDVIAAGVLMVREIMDLMDAKELTTADYGLLEGIAAVATQMGQGMKKIRPDRTKPTDDVGSV